MTNDMPGVSSRDLKPGDHVTVQVEGVVGTPIFTRNWVLEYGQEGHVVIQHDSPWVTVTRAPKPLPPEPPVGAHVLDADRDTWKRCDGGWSLGHGPRDDCADYGHRTFADLLQRHGPVRLLGDPIEAP